MHLAAAEQIIAHPTLTTPARHALTTNRPAFYLGSIAPDYQAICDIPRIKTHFYSASDFDPTRAEGWPRLAQQYPHLANHSSQSAGEATFWAGYCAHLLYDVFWLEGVFKHFATPEAERDSKEAQHRYMAQNSLLTYYDQQALQALPPSAESWLTSAPLPNETPFLRQAILHQWQAMIVGQLAPNAPVMTVQIYAKRMKLSAEQFAGLLADPVWLEQTLSAYIDLDRVKEVEQQALETSVEALNHFFSESPPLWTIDLPPHH